MADGPVWVDLANSPHVLFFEPVLRELARRRIAAVVTAREFAQTVSLCTLLGIEAEVIGHHGGRSLGAKATNLAQRVRALCAFAQAVRPSVAVSLNSYSQAVAGRVLGLPVMTAMDYEYQPANHLAFRCARLVAVPDAFPLDRLRRQGVRLSKAWRFPGLKEEIALAGFRSAPGYLASVGVDAGCPVVVVRPPADMALYHRFENPLFAHLLERFITDATINALILPRTPGQANSLERAGFGRLLWRGRVLDGRQLIAGVDAVISAGGSMNREAAVLGTPAYSLYAGRLAAVDSALFAKGKLHLLKSAQDIDALAFVKKTSDPPPTVDDSLLRQFVDKILEVAGA